MRRCECHVEARKLTLCYEADSDMATRPAALRSAVRTNFMSKTSMQILRLWKWAEVID
jgi:hypothetical protein